jgi:hypothetical protein
VHNFPVFLSGAAILAARDARHRTADWGDGVFGRHEGVDTLRRELERVDALIAAHPLASPRIRAAHEIVGEGRSRDAAETERLLADRGLAGAEELGRAQVAGSWSWWKLHRRRRQLVRRIERLEHR